MSLKTQLEGWVFVQSNGHQNFLDKSLNADLKICQYLPFHMKTICWRFHIKTCFTWDMHMWDIRKVWWQTFGNNGIC